MRSNFNQVLEKQKLQMIAAFVLAGGMSQISNFLGEDLIKIQGFVK